MNVLDILIIATICVLIWVGSMQRPIRQVSISIGAISGLLLGAIIYNHLSFLATGSIARTAILGLLIMAAGFMCYDILMTLGRHLDSRTKSSRRTKRDRIISALVAGLGGIIILWLSIDVFSTITVPFIQKQVTTSSIVAFTHKTLRPPLLFKKTAQLLNPFTSPQMFVDSEPSYDDATISKDFTELDSAAAKTASSVFKVSSWGCGATNVGSGFLVSDSAIVTNAHVVAGADRIVIQDRNASSTYPVEVIWFDPALDMAILRTAMTLPQTPLTLQPNAAATGTLASVLGYPGGNTFADTDAVILQRLAAKGYDIYNKNTVTRSIYALRAEVVPGNSGGPLITSSGEVIGLMLGHSTMQDHTGYAVASSQIAPGVHSALTQNRAVSSGSCTM